MSNRHAKPVTAESLLREFVVALVGEEFNLRPSPSEEREIAKYAAKFDEWARGKPMTNLTGKLIVYNLTPDQAIAATLGNGTCEDLGGTDHNGEQVFNCSKCGCVLRLYDNEGVNTLCTHFVYDYPRFCPSCGRELRGDA